MAPTSILTSLALCALGAAPSAPKGMPILLSKAWDGSNATESSAAPATSKNGRYVAFLTDSMGISGADAEGQVVVLDRETGWIERVSRSLTGEATNAPCERVTISGDGRIVAYSTRATDVASPEDPDDDLDLDIYRYDRATGITERVSVLDATHHADADCGDFDLSDDGRFVAFASESLALFPASANGHAQIYLRDCALGMTRIISAATGGEFANAACGTPKIDDDGSRIVFVSAATNLGDSAVTAGVTNVWLADAWKGKLRLLSKSTGGAPSNGGSYAPAISPDGRYVAFVSTASNLVPNGPNATPTSIYLHDAKLAKSVRLPVAPKGLEHPTFLGLDLSRQAKHLAFLARDDSLGRVSIGWYARSSKTTRVVTIGPGGEPMFAGSHGSPVISSDGRFALFDSTDDALSPEADTASDVYLYRR